MFYLCYIPHCTASHRWPFPFRCTGQRSAGRRWASARRTGPHSGWADIGRSCSSTVPSTSWAASRMMRQCVFVVWQSKKVEEMAFEQQVDHTQKNTLFHNNDNPIRMVVVTRNTKNRPDNNLCIGVGRMGVVFWVCCVCVRWDSVKWFVLVKHEWTCRCVVGVTLRATDYARNGNDVYDSV